MNPTQNTGSFGSILGGLSPELQAAIQGRATGGTSQQVSNAAPTAAPQPTALRAQPGVTAAGSGPIGQSLTGGNPEGMGQQPLQNAGQAPSTTMPFDPAEVKVILSAMNGRMKTIGRLQGDLKG